MSTLRNDNFKLRQQVEEIEARVKRRDTRIAELRTAQRDLEQKLEREIELRKQAEENLTRAREEFEESQGDAVALWDETDRVWRCSGCSWEIEEDACPTCEAAEFDIPEDQQPEQSCSTISQAETPDRVSSKRGSTPISQFHIRVPDKWERESRSHEYRELIKRGATPLMCDTFDLEFGDDTGIYAYADQPLFDEFAGKGMKEGDIWKIYLGRRMELDADDHDGSEFIEGLLEDVLLFDSAGRYRWETVKEGPAVWVTRPTNEMDQALETGDVESSDGGHIQSPGEGEDGQEDWDEGDEDDGGNFDRKTDYTMELKTWVHRSQHEDPETKLAVVENKYYNTDDDGVDDVSVHSEASNDIDMDVENVEASTDHDVKQEEIEAALTVTVVEEENDDDMDFESASSESSYDSDFDSDT